MIRISLEGWKPLDNREIYFQSVILALLFSFLVALWPVRYFKYRWEVLTEEQLRAEIFEENDL